MDDIAAGFSGLFLVYALYFVNVASPGPSNLAVMATSMERGRVPGLALAAGVIAGSFTWAGLAAAGVAALLQVYAGAMVFLKIAGGLYLFWLAWRSARAAMRKGDLPPAIAAPRGLGRLFVRGYLMHITNPKAILGWAATMTLALRVGEAEAPMVSILGGCFAIGVGVFGSYALVFSTGAVMRGYRRVRRGAEAALSVFFAYAGFRLLTARV
jgi:threonine/homoserine/homoserine lactone efflux protein